MSVPPRLALLTCSVFEAEIVQHAAGAEHIRHRQQFEIGLHDQPDKLRTTLQEAIHCLDTRDDLDAIVLLYGLCGRGTAGLRAGRHPLVIARAHDCITHFLGSKELFAAQQTGHRYYYTPGWNRARRVPGPDREAALRKELETRFDTEDVDFLIESDRAAWQTYSTVAFLDLGTPDAEREANYAKGCAEWLGWSYERLTGDPSLLRDLLWGHWDHERFQIARPGEALAHVVNNMIFDVKSA